MNIGAENKNCTELFADNDTIYLTNKHKKELGKIQITDGNISEISINNYKDSSIQVYYFGNGKLNSYTEFSSYNSRDKIEFYSTEDSYFYHDSGIDSLGYTTGTYEYNPNGYEILFEENGKILQIGQYILNKEINRVFKHGVWSFYNQNGSVFRQVQYSEDSIIWARNY